MPVDVKYLEKYLDLHRVKGWVALHPKAGFSLSDFRTPRLAKLVDYELFLFSIGATKLGDEMHLNDTIRSIVLREGVDILEGLSTDGSSKPKKEYPGFNLQSLNNSQFDRIILQVIGAITQIQHETRT